MENRIWTYYRINVGDVDFNLLEQQLSELNDFTVQSGYKVVNRTCDREDGMDICRSSLHEIYESAFAGKLDILAVMDLAHISPVKSRQLFFQNILKNRNVDIIALNEEKEVKEHV